MLLQQRVGLVMIILLFGGIGYASVCHAADPVFQAISDTDKPLYRFDVKLLFYSNDAARMQDIGRVNELLTALKELKPNAGSDPQALFKSIELSEEIWTLADRVWAYGTLRVATNTQDTTFVAESQEGEELQGKVRSELSFIISAISALTREQLDDFIKKEPRLQKYSYFLRKSQGSAHRASPEVEEALAGLDLHLDPFRRPFRNLMIKRSPDASVSLGGKELKVTDANEYAELLRTCDRGIRRKAFETRMATYRAQADLFGYALLEKTRTANKVATMRDFADSSDEAYEGLELDSELVGRVLGEFEKNAGLAIRFQKAEAEYQRKILGLAEAAPWDVDTSPAALQPPQHTIRNASDAVLAATEVFGKEYRKEMEHLLEPRNGRMDIVPAPNRQDGDFTAGSYGTSWAFFMHGYDGHTNQVVTLAHEAAHSVHFRLLFNSGVPYYYSDGARYFVEGCAKINELLILDTLTKLAKNDAERLYYKRQTASKLASVRFTSMYWSAFATAFERDVVKGVRSGEIKTADQIHDVWAKYGKKWSIDFEGYPDLKYTWPDTHHFLTGSRQYAQYLFAWVVALAFYEKAQSDPMAGERFVAMMKRGFSDRSANLLKEEMGIVLDDPALLQRMFQIVEQRVAAFEEEVAK